MGWLHGEKQRMRSEAAALRRRLDESASVRSDGSQRPRRPTRIERLKRVLRIRTERSSEVDGTR